MGFMNCIQGFARYEFRSVGTVQTSNMISSIRHMELRFISGLSSSLQARR